MKVEKNALPKVTKGSLSVALEAITSAKDDVACGQALVAATILLQESIVNGQPLDDVQQVFSTVTGSGLSALTTVIDRAVTCHLTDYAGKSATLVTWLYPVILSSPEPLPSVIPLETGSLSGLKLSAYLKEQLKTDAWVSVSPVLLSSEQIRLAELDDLIKYPLEVKDSIAGKRDVPAFPITEEVSGVAPGANCYFVPVVVCHTDRSFALPVSNERTRHRLDKWVADSLNMAFRGKIQIDALVARVPYPFSDAVDAGERLELDVRLRELVLTVSARSNIEPKGMAASVAPYVTNGLQQNQALLGVTLASRLTTDFIGTVALPVNLTNDGPGPVISLTNSVLNDLGIEVITSHANLVGTRACQCCGNLQFLMPDIVGSKKSLEPSGSKLH